MQLIFYIHYKIKIRENKIENIEIYTIREKEKEKIIEIKKSKVKELLKKIEEEKTLKYLQRMNRYKIHGPIIYPPPCVLKKYLIRMIGEIIIAGSQK